MEGYSAPPDYYDNEEDLGDDDAKVKKKLKVKRAKKDPNTPKQPMHAYMLYSNSSRAKIWEKDPGISLGAAAKQIGSQYKTIRADKKAVWQQSKVDAAKEVHKKEMTKYNLTKPVAVVKEKPNTKPKGKNKKLVPVPEISEKDTVQEVLNSTTELKSLEKWEKSDDKKYLRSNCGMWTHLSTE